MGFRGLVVCDDLEMGGVLQGRSMEEAAAEALRAGCDVLLTCGPSANTERVFDALLREAESDERFCAIVEQASSKVLLTKKRLGIIGEHSRRQPPDFEALREEIRRFSADVSARLEARGFPKAWQPSSVPPEALNK